MGCNIHTYVETYDRTLDRWKMVNNFAMKRLERNYNLFAILAGIRNYVGFIPIKPPTGIPQDTSNGVLQEIIKWGTSYIHSYSYYTLKELQKVNWDAGIDKTGYVDVEEYINFKKLGYTETYLKSVEKRPITYTIVTNEEMDKIVKNVSYIGVFNIKHNTLILKRGFNVRLAPMKKAYVTKISWKQKYSYFTGEWFKFMEEMEKLVKNPEDVRVIFFFDN